MDANQYLFDAISQLTGGIIGDLKSMFLGGIVIGFILIGLDHLKEAFEHMLDARDHGRYLEDAKQLRWEMDQYERGSAEWDEANYSYRQTIGKAAKSRLRSWK